MEGDLPKHPALRRTAVQLFRWRQLRAVYSPSDCARRMKLGALRAARLEALYIGQTSLLLNRKGRRLAVQNQQHVKAVHKARPEGFTGPWSRAYGGGLYQGEPRVRPFIDWSERAFHHARAVTT